MAQIIESTEQHARRMKTNVCHRSSAIFFAQSGAGLDTTLSFLNHFLLKRDIPVVDCKITIRDLAGAILAAHRFAVTEPRVYSVRVSDLVDTFIGSAEVEFFSSANLFVPFCAVIATYESRDGFCQLHAYSRTYNDEELNEDRVLQKVAEIGWTMRDDDVQSSFIVLHNGPAEVRGDVRFLLTNHAGDQRDIVLPDYEIAPYGTMMFSPKDHLDIADFLQGGPGHGAAFLTASRAFPRMFCGNRRMEGGATVDLQATHSNFNYSVFETPRLPPGDLGYTFVPHLMHGGEADLVVYPHHAPTENVSALAGGAQFAVTHGAPTWLPAEPGETVTFQTDDKRGLPNRLVNGVLSRWSPDRVEAECSLGIITAGYKADTKHWHWGLAGRPGLSGCISGFFASDFLPTENFKDLIDVAIYDEVGQCGAASVPMDDFRAGPIDIGAILSREPKGWMFYRAQLDYTMAAFFSTVYDTEKKSGSVEHSF